MKDTPTLSLGREALLALGSKVLMAVVGFGGYFLFTFLIGREGMGNYEAVLAAAFVLAQIPAGVGTAVKKRVSEVEVEPPEFLGAGLVAHAVFTVLLVAVYLLVEPWAADYFGSRDLAFGVVLVVFSLGLFNVTNRFYSGTGHPAASSWADALRSVLTFAAQLLLVWLGLSTFGLVAGLVAATFVTGVVSAVAARVTPAIPTGETARAVYEFARWSVPTSLLTNFYSSADVLIIKGLAGVALVGPVGASGAGMYGLARRLAVPAGMFAGSIRDALSVKSSGVDSAGGDVRADLANSLSYTGLVAVPLFFGALALDDALLRFFDQSYAEGPALAITGMALFQVFNTYRLPFEAVLEGTDRPRTIFRVNVLVLVVHLPLAVALGWRFGLLGVVAATIVAEAMRVVVYQYIAHTAYGGIVLTRPMGEQVLAGVAMLGVVVGLREYVVSIQSLLWLVVVVGTGAAVYFAFLLAVSAHFRDTLRAVLPVTLPGR
jgi:O-antigen/teichoic acid export membrane protein